jgi:regulatory protein YycH of two-component signal transduction system YycFG
MNWIKWIGHSRKIFVFLKENKELIKSVVLTLLIALSLVLTWSLWTFKPNLSVLENTRTVKKQQVADPKKLNDLVYPTQIIFHQGSDLYGAEAHPIVDTFHEMLSEAKFYFDAVPVKSEDFDPESNPINPNIKNNEYIEIIYPTAMTQEVYKEVFPFDMEISASKPQNVDRLFLYQTSNGSTEGYLVSYQQKKMHRIKVNNLPFDTLLHEMEEAKGESGAFTPYIVFDIKERNEEGADEVKRRFYFPKKQIELNRYAYISKAITEETYDKYKKALFKDPLAVKGGATDNKEITYTDGTAAMVVNEVKNRFKYDNFADPGNQNIPQSLSPLFQSLEYVNTHAGWGNPYILSNVSSYNASFWLYIKNLPVLDPDMEMSLTWYESELYRYERSMIQLQLNSKPYPDALREKVTLPSGESVIQELLEADYNINYIQDIRIGFTMKRQSEPHIYILEPRWFFNFENKGWQPLFKEHREGGY